MRASQIPATARKHPFLTLCILAAIAFGGFRVGQYWYNNVYWTTVRNYYGLYVKCQMGSDNFIWTNVQKIRFRAGILEIFVNVHDTVPCAVYRSVDSHAVTQYSGTDYDSVLGCSLSAIPVRQEVKVADFVQQRREYAEKQRLKKARYGESASWMPDD